MSTTELQQHKFMVYSLDVAGGRTTLGYGLDKYAAASVFWHYANNFSAKCGIIQYVAIMDETEQVNLAWDHDRGYSYDGETWTDKPVIEDEGDDYKKKA